MEHGTTLLFGLPGVSVSSAEPTADGGRVVEVVTADAAAARCPDCGSVSTSVKQNVVTGPKDLPYGESELVLRWRKRRWRWRRPDCAIQYSRLSSQRPEPLTPPNLAALVLEPISGLVTLSF